MGGYALVQIMQSDAQTCYRGKRNQFMTGDTDADNVPLVSCAPMAGRAIPIKIGGQHEY